MPYLAFLIVHIYLVCFGEIYHDGMTIYDLNYYHSVTSKMFVDNEWVIFGTAPGTVFLYPPLALLAMWVPYLMPGALGSIQLYRIGWYIFMLVLNGLVFWRLRRASITSPPASRIWKPEFFWIIFLFLLGPISITRLDSVITPLTILAILAIPAKMNLSASLLTLGAWIKLLPAALLIPVWAFYRAFRTRILPIAIGASLVIAAIGLIGGAPVDYFKFLLGNQERSLQIESVWGTPFMLFDAIIGDSSHAFYDQESLSMELEGVIPRFLAHYLVFPFLGLVIIALSWLTLRIARNLKRYPQFYLPVSKSDLDQSNLSALISIRHFDESAPYSSFSTDASVSTSILRSSLQSKASNMTSSSFKQPFIQLAKTIHPTVYTTKAELICVSGLALFLALIIFNKVGSPQFYSILAAPLIGGLIFSASQIHWFKLMGSLGLIIAGLTYLVYPLTYNDVSAVHLIPVLVLAARNILALYMFYRSVKLLYELSNFP